MERTFNRIVRLIRRRYDSMFPHGHAVPFALRTTSGLSHTFGRGEPAFALVVTTTSGISALSPLDLSRIAEAYVRGALEVEGDLRRALVLRTAFPDRHPVAYLWRFLQPLLFGQVRSDARYIAAHYDLPPEFWMTFLDGRHRCYSHGFFERDDEPLADAMTRKLEFALAAIDAKPGDRVLDIGGGWGAVTEYAGRRGVRITSLTISRPSEQFLRDLIAREQLPCTVLLEHLMEHVPEAPYDGIVNLGVTEHLPNYRATLSKYLQLLKPGGKIYLDAAAAPVKHSESTFLEQHIYPGNGTLLCLHEYLAEVARTPLQLLSVQDDRHNYYLTTRRWAENLDAHREVIERGWGAELYRKFRLYLWGCADSFDRNLTQAYHWVMRKPAEGEVAVRS
jgi:cyclopropane-fatty-acyl-phospholipid synthase